MATAWQTLEEAALTLGISSRTLHRRIVKGEFETRLENGRREVLIAVPQSSADASDMSDTSATATAVEEPVADFAEQSQSMSDVSADDIGGTMLALHEDRIRRTDLAIMAYQQSVNVTAASARSAGRNVRIAWGVAGGLTVAMFLSVIWATHSVTKAKGEVTHLNTVVRHLSDTADKRSRDAEQFRKDAETARLAAAKVEEQLDAAKSRLEELNREKSDIAAKLAATSVTTQPATTQPIH
jgi:hypothetical protein